MLKKNVSKTKSNDFYKFTQMIILFQLTLKMTGAQQISAPPIGWQLSTDAQNTFFFPHGPSVALQHEIWLFSVYTSPLAKKTNSLGEDGVL